MVNAMATLCEAVTRATFHAVMVSVVLGVVVSGSRIPYQGKVHHTDHRPDRVHIAAFSDIINRGACCFLAAAAHHQWVPEITTKVSPDQDLVGKLPGKMIKIAFWRSLANKYPPDDIVWVVDGWDVVT